MERSRCAEAKAILGAIRTAQTAYKLSYGGYAASLAEIGVEAPAVCESTHYFRYYLGDSNNSAFAARCGSGGKYPDYPSCPYHCRTEWYYGNVFCGVYQDGVWVQRW
ncbi:MAG: hypothetical protein WC301_01410 [Candidatus Omnitrophota bacterium]